jgi:two-component system response regulator AdeR
VNSPLVLIVEDEQEIADGLAGFLARAGYRTRHAGDGLSALEAFFNDQPDLVLLDLMLPGIGGLEVLRAVRGAEADWQRATPVIALTSRTSQEDRLRGFEHGADDYVPKPFWPKEVVARVDAVLRRVRKPTETVLHGSQGLELNLETRQVHQGETIIELRPAEFELLTTFLRAPNRVFTRAELLEAVRGGDSESLERTVDTHVANLRRKLGEDHGLETVFGVGYRYVAP